MSLMVRLEGLPPNVDPGHIQYFFTGLKIRHGGVNIVGGVRGEAFVKFASIHNFCLALKRSGKRLMDAPIYLSLHTSLTKPGYLHISFRPLDARLSDVKCFFKGLFIGGVIFFTRNKVRTGQALVKFEQEKIAPPAFQLLKNFKKGHKKQETFSVLSMKKSSRKEWLSNGGKIDPCPKNNNPASSTWKWLPEISVDDRKSGCYEFYAHLVNVSLRAQKSHIKKFLHDLVSDSQIKFRYDKNGIRQRECFVMFITENDYVQALQLDKAVLKGRRLRVLPISKKNMMDLIISNGEDDLEDPISEEQRMEPDVKYLYLRNFAACVNKLDVINFFTGFSLTEKDICLLYDHNGGSLGEALVRFSIKEASEAEKLNHKRFQDTEILLRCISKEQLKAFGVDSFLKNCSTASRDSSTKMESCRADVCVSEADDLPEVTCDAV